MPAEKRYAFGEKTVAKIAVAVKKVLSPDLESGPYPPTGGFRRVVLVKVTSAAAGGGKYNGRIIAAGSAAVASGDLAVSDLGTVAAADNCLVLHLPEMAAGTHVIDTAGDAVYFDGVVIGATSENKLIVTIGSASPAAAIIRWGKATADWSSATPNTITLTPCLGQDDDTATGEDDVECTIVSPKDAVPKKVAIAAGDILAFTDIDAASDPPTGLLWPTVVCGDCPTGLTYALAYACADDGRTVGVPVSELPGTLPYTFLFDGECWTVADGYITTEEPARIATPRAEVDDCDDADCDVAGGGEGGGTNACTECGTAPPPTKLRVAIANVTVDTACYTNGPTFSTKITGGTAVTAGKFNYTADLIQGGDPGSPISNGQPVDTDCWWEKWIPETVGAQAVDVNTWTNATCTNPDSGTSPTNVGLRIVVVKSSATQGIIKVESFGRNNGVVLFSKVFNWGECATAIAGITNGITAFNTPYGTSWYTNTVSETRAKNGVASIAPLYTS